MTTMMPKIYTSLFLDLWIMGQAHLRLRCVRRKPIEGAGEVVVAIEVEAVAAAVAEIEGKIVVYEAEEGASHNPSWGHYLKHQGNLVLPFNFLPNKMRQSHLQQLLNI